MPNHESRKKQSKPSSLEHKGQKHGENHTDIPQDQSIFSVFQQRQGEGSSKLKLSPESVYQLQRTIGNQAVLTMLNKSIQRAKNANPNDYKQTAWYNTLKTYEKRFVEDLASKQNNIITKDQAIKSLKKEQLAVSDAIFKHIKNESDMDDYVKFFDGGDKSENKLTLSILRKLILKSAELGIQPTKPFTHADLPALPNLPPTQSKKYNTTSSVRDDSHKDFYKNTSSELDKLTPANHKNKVGAVDMRLCQQCGFSKDVKEFAKDHQHPWATLRDDLVKVARRISNDANAIKLAKNHFGNLFSKLFEEEKETINNQQVDICYPKDDLWRYYSNDLNNLSYMCTKCNSADKKTSSAQDSYKNAHYFGQGFLTQGQQPSGPFNVPSNGWGGKARDWLNDPNIKKDIQPLINFDINHQEIHQTHQESFKALHNPNNTKHDRGNMDLVNTAAPLIQNAKESIETFKDKFPAYSDPDSEDEFKQDNKRRQSESFERRNARKVEVQNPDILNAHRTTALKLDIEGVKLPKQQLESINAQRQRLREKAFSEVYNSDSDPMPNRQVDTSLATIYTNYKNDLLNEWNTEQNNWNSNDKFSDTFAEKKSFFPQAVKDKISKFCYP